MSLIFAWWLNLIIAFGSLKDLKIKQLRKNAICVVLALPLQIQKCNLRGSFECEAIGTGAL